MLSPRDWIERLRRPAPRRLESPMAPRPAALPDVFELPSDLREVLLDLERRGQLRRALQMAPDRALLATHLSGLLAQHGAEAFREALALVDLPEGTRVVAPVPRPVPPLAAPTKVTPPPAPAPPPPPSKSVGESADAGSLAPEVATQLGNLNVNQWRDTRTTDGWYGPGREGKAELFVQRSVVPPRLLKELGVRGVILGEAQGIAASASMTYTVQAGRLSFKGVLGLDVEKLKSILGASFEAMHARWDAAERKYPVKVIRGEEVKHEAVG